MSSTILIAYHSADQAITHQIGDFLTTNGCKIYLISENVPNKVSERAQLVKVCGVLLAIADRGFQKSSACLELLHYARDLKKKIFGINVNPTSFVPFGPLGAIVCGTQQGFMNLSNPTNDEFEACLRPLIECSKKLSANEGAKSAREDFRSPTPSVPLEFNQTSAVNVLISTHADSMEIARIVEEGLTNSELKCRVEDTSSGSSSVAVCKVLVIIMSPGYEADVKARLIAEKARSLGLPIIPVSKTREWKPQAWLGLIVAGVLFFRIFDRQKAYDVKYDSCPMKDLTYEVTKAMPKLKSDEIEKKMIDSLNNQIEECKAKLGPDSWPPPTKPAEIIVRQPVRVKLEEPKADIEFKHTHYDIRRITMPPPVFDEYGRPLRKRFDCMISYQWDIQELVREIYMDFISRNMSAWFDIWGFMEENTYKAMATAVECARVLVVFVTEKYQKSDNCIMEFKYAVFCGKPFVFILSDPNLELQPWLKTHVDQHPCFVVQRYNDLMVMRNKVPLINVITQAIRTIGQAQPDHDVYDVSEEVIRLKKLLESARDAIGAKSGTSRFRTCQRCKKEYDENNAAGCKIHSAYYMGGTIMEGRWVCCNQQSRDSMGCRDAPHSDVTRTWTRNPNYGTSTWEPH